MKFSEFAEINPTILFDKNKEYDFVEMADIQPGTRFVYPKIKKSRKGGAKFQNDDTLFARISPCLENGKIAQVKGIESEAAFGSTEFYVFRGREAVSDSTFVYYLSQTEIIRGPAEKSMTGASGRQRAGIDAIKNIDVPNISLQTQKAVGSILSSYDNLINNNSRRIAILEDMVRSLYTEWLVKFRFPGHKKYEFTDSLVGLIPKGWEVKAASDVIDIAPKIALPKDGEKPFVAMPSISTSSMIIGDIEMRTGNSGTKFMNGDTLMARITPCLQNGKIGFVQFLDEINPIGFGSTEFIVMRSKELTPEFVYCLVRSDSFKGNAINSMAGADGRQRVKNDCFNSHYLAVPPKSILDQFSALAEPAFKEIFTLSQKNKNLGKQRDMLLPKLISGNIKLKE